MPNLPAVSASCIVSITGASQDESLAACVNSCHAAKSGVYNFSVLHFMPHILLMFSGFLLLLQLRLLLPLPFLSPLLSLVFENEISNVWQQMFFSFIRKSSAFIFRLVHSKRLALMRSLVASSPSLSLSLCFFFINFFLFFASFFNKLW